MKRTSKVKINHDGTIVEAVVKTSTKHLSRFESEQQHDVAVDRVVEALRHIPYLGTAPLRSVRIL
jgi:hypothetical protein